MIRVLLADDHAVMREGLAGLLQTHADITVVASVSNGREAVEHARRLAPDVAILDIMMPEMNGIDATRRILECSPATRVLVLSMQSTPEHVMRALKAGAFGYLLKESAAQEVIEAVRTVHAGRRYFGKQVADIVTEQVASGSEESPVARLTLREREVLQLVAEGCTSTEIARRLHLSSKTVDTYRSRLMDKLKVSDVAGLVRSAIRGGLVEP